MGRPPAAELKRNGPGSEECVTPSQLERDLAVPKQSKVPELREPALAASRSRPGTSRRPAQSLFG